MKVNQLQGIKYVHINAIKCASTTQIGEIHEFRTSHGLIHENIGQRNQVLYLEDP